MMPEKTIRLLYVGKSLLGGPSNSLRPSSSPFANFAYTLSKNSLQTPPVSIAGWLENVILKGRDASNPESLYMTRASESKRSPSVVTLKKGPFSFFPRRLIIDGMSEMN